MIEPRYHIGHGNNELRGRLSFSAVLTANTSLLLRSVAWHQRLSQFRKGVPLFLVHDFGHALRSAFQEEFSIGVRKKAMARLLENGLAQDKENHQKIVYYKNGE